MTAPLMAVPIACHRLTDGMIAITPITIRAIPRIHLSRSGNAIINIPTTIAMMPIHNPVILIMIVLYLLCPIRTAVSIMTKGEQ